MSKTPLRVNQKALAAALGLTDRRVRQMIEERLLPPPGADGLHDVARAQQRYALYQDDDRAGQAWEAFLSGLERRAGKVDLLVKKALKPQAGWQALREASTAAQDLFDDLAFVNAARGRSDGERTFVAMMWREKENDVLGALVTHGKKLAKKLGPPPAVLRNHGCNDHG